MSNCLLRGTPWLDDVIVVDGKKCGASQQMATFREIDPLKFNLCMWKEWNGIANGKDFSLVSYEDECHIYHETDPFAKQVFCIDCTVGLELVLFLTVFICGILSLMASGTVAVSASRRMKREPIPKKKDFFRTVLFMSIANISLSVFVILHLTLVDFVTFESMDRIFGETVKWMLLLSLLATQACYFWLSIEIIFEASSFCMAKCNRKILKRIFSFYPPIILAIHIFMEITNDMKKYQPWTFLFISHSDNGLFMRTWWMLLGSLTMVFSLFSLAVVCYKVHYRQLGRLANNLLMKAVKFVVAYALTWSPMVLYYITLCFHYFGIDHDMSHRHHLSSNSLFYLTSCFFGIGSYLVWVICFEQTQEITSTTGNIALQEKMLPEEKKSEGKESNSRSSTDWNDNNMFQKHTPHEITM